MMLHITRGMIFILSFALSFLVMVNPLSLSPQDRNVPKSFLFP